MSAQGRLVLATFWAVFVTTPGPNAVDCVTDGMTLGLCRSPPAVGAVPCRASLLLALPAAGVAALLAAAPGSLRALPLAGAGVLIAPGVRGRVAAGAPEPGRAFAIATIDARSVAGHLAAPSQFVEPGVPPGRQMRAIVPTAPGLTATSDTGHTALGAGLGRPAPSAILNPWVRRATASPMVAYGVAPALRTPRPA